MTFLRVLEAAKVNKNYLEKSRDDSAARSRESYLKDPEKSHARNRESYMKDPENSRADSVARSSASCYTVSTTLFRILHVTFTVSCMTFFRVFQVTLTAPCSTIIATLLQIFLVTFARRFRAALSARPYSDRSCNFRGFVHPTTFSCSCHGFVLHCQHGSSLDLLDNLPSFYQPSSDRLTRSKT